MKWKAEINGFKNFLQLEKGLSPKSIEAYLSDVNKLAQYFESIQSDVSLQEIKLNDLRDFLVEIAEIGLSARSQARIISVLNAFFDYLLLEELVKESPTELL